MSKLTAKIDTLWVWSDAIEILNLFV